MCVCFVTGLSVFRSFCSARSFACFSLWRGGGHAGIVPKYANKNNFELAKLCFLERSQHCECAVQLLFFFADTQECPSADKARGLLQ